jgi:hypothetical protein
MEQTECSEKSAYQIQTPVNYPEESTTFYIITLFLLHRLRIVEVLVWFEKDKEKLWPILSQYRNIYVHPNDIAKEMVQKSVLYPYRRDRKRMRCKKKQVLTKCKLREVKIRSVHRIMYAAAKLEGPRNSSEFQSRVLFDWQWSEIHIFCQNCVVTKWPCQ